MIAKFFDFTLNVSDSNLICEEVVNLCKKRDTNRWLACLNPHSYAVALDDKLFFSALNNAHILIPDGIGLVWLSRIFNLGIKSRTTGSDIFWQLNEKMNKNNDFSVFFLGSTENTLSLIRKRMQHDYPKVKIVGMLSPAFKENYTDHEMKLMVKAINAVNPDILWVGLTAPKQEKWIYANRARLKVGYSLAVGAVFDFYAQNVKRPSKFSQFFGLEWAVRFLRQPRKLWRRVFVSVPRLIFYLVFYGNYPRD
jgi:N-acetylglucosaminyldiphosphoundecaprenol N-acetyl-beta-D-mannosaminyltransferase